MKKGELPKKKDDLWQMWKEKKKNTTPLALYVVLGIFSSKGYPQLLGGKTQLVAAQLMSDSKGGYSAASPLALEKRNVVSDVLQKTNRQYCVAQDAQLSKLTPEKMVQVTTHARARANIQHTHTHTQHTHTHTHTHTPHTHTKQTQELVGLQGNSNLGWKVDSDTAKGVNTSAIVTRATTASGRTSAKKKREDDKDQLIRQQVQARATVAEKKKLPPKRSHRKRAQSVDARTDSTSQGKAPATTVATVQKTHKELAATPAKPDGLIEFMLAREDKHREANIARDIAREDKHREDRHRENTHRFQLEMQAFDVFKQVMTSSCNKRRRSTSSSDDSSSSGSHRRKSKKSKTRARKKNKKRSTSSSDDSSSSDSSHRRKSKKSKKRKKNKKDKKSRPKKSRKRERSPSRSSSSDESTATSSSDERKSKVDAN